MKDPEFLQAALAGYQQQLIQVKAKIAELQGKLKGQPASAPVPAGDRAAAPERKRRTLSPAARKRIAEAQRKRWAAVRAAQETPAAKKATKRGSRTAAKKSRAGRRSAAKSVGARNVTAAPATVESPSEA